MACTKTTNCDKFPNYPCYDTEQKCKCRCEDGGADPESDECKCLDEIENCVNGTVRKRDCKCFCGTGKYLDDGVCYPFEYSCNGTQCVAVKGTGQYKNLADCNSNCGNHPPFCFPVPTAPVGTPLLCPDNTQYGIIMYTFDYPSCQWRPFEIIWGACGGGGTPGGSSSTSGGTGGSSGTSSASPCNCTAMFNEITDSATEICGTVVPLIATVRPVFAGCALGVGSMTIYEWCDTCDCTTGKPILKDMQVWMPCPAYAAAFEDKCGEWCLVPIQGFTPGDCDATCPSTTSSASPECVTAILAPPTTIDGVTITADKLGAVDTDTVKPFWLTCEDIVFPPNSVRLGKELTAGGPTDFMYTLRFSPPVTSITIALGATGPASNELFGLVANNENNDTIALTVTAAESCYSSVTSPVITSGAGAPAITNVPGYLITQFSQGGGGGLFTVTGDIEFTSLSVIGEGGNDGALFGVLRACPNSSSSSFSSNPSCTATSPTAITFTGHTQTGTPFGSFGPGDSALVTIYTADSEYAKSVNTEWKFYVNYGPARTRYEITQGDFSAAPTLPMFNLTSEQLLAAIGLSFETAPDGAYDFELCAEATNCANLYDNDCAVSHIVVNVTGNGPGSSSSGEFPTSSSSAGVASSSSVSQTIGNRVLYFVGANTTDGTDWHTLTNWRYGSENGPVPATLPDPTDDVVLVYTVEKNSGTGAPCVNNLTFLAPTEAYSLEIAVDVAGTATFSGRAFINKNTSVVPVRVGKITGNTVFNGFAQNFGVVNGDAVFNNGSVHFGEINGAAVFNGTTLAMNNSIVRCNATFNDNSNRQSGAQVYGTVTCNTVANCATTTAGACNNTPMQPCGAAFTLPMRTLGSGCISDKNCAPVYTARVFTKTLPATCPVCPAGWEYQNGQCAKTIGIFNSAEDCGQAILEEKKNGPRLHVTSSDGLNYAVLLHFESYLCHRHCEGGRCLIYNCAPIDAEQFT